MIRRVRRRRLSDAVLLRLRLAGFGLVACALFGLLTVQLWQLQVVRGEEYREQAELNRVRVRTISPPRGLIFDRHGSALVQNVPSFTVALVPADLPEDPVEEGLVLAKLSRILSIPIEEIQATLEQMRAEQRLFEPVRLADGVKRDHALLLEERQSELPGVVVRTDAERHYPHGALVSHLTGYMGRISAQQYALLREQSYLLNDRLGQAGIEASYEQALRGQPGSEVIEVNAYGRAMQTLASRPAEPGANVVLNIDLDLQKVMTDALREGMGASKWGVAIAVAPQTGEVLGMVSLPTFDNNVFANPGSSDEVAELLTDPRHPLLNYAISGPIPPGSTYKVFVGSAALQERVATPSTTIVSTGGISIGAFSFPDWAAHGALNFYTGISRSSDVYFYYLAGGYQNFQGLGIDRVATYSRAFGFGELSGVDLPGEATGLVPDPSWKEENVGLPWFIGDTYHVGIGQGFVLSTPLQLAMATAAIANGGELLQPQVAREIVAGNGQVVVPFEKKVIRRIPVDPRHLAVVRTAMWMAVEPGGTATEAQVRGVRVAGKTGTAEYAGPLERDGSLPTHGVFVSFAPLDDPQIALVIFVERGRGAQTAAPIAGRILKSFFGKDLPATGIVANR